jgi:Putative lumazine-binding
MNNFLFLMLLATLTTTAACNQQSPASATESAMPKPIVLDAAIEQAITGFITGGDTRNVPLLESVMHPDFRTTVNQFMGGEGVTILDRATYLGMISQGKFGGIPRTLQVVHFTSFGHTALVQVHMESTELAFDNFLLVVQDKGGKWQILNDAAVAKPKKG